MSIITDSRKFRDCHIITADGERIPLRVERLDFSPGMIGPEITGYMLPRERRYEDRIQKVIFNYPATVVIWSDGTKTVVKCQPGDTYSKELGLAMCISKKYLGNKGNFNEVFKKWIPEDEEPTTDDLNGLRDAMYNLGKSLGNIVKTIPTIPEMRNEISRYCSARRCDECEINRVYDPRPGRCFDTDEDVIKHYNAIKEDK